MRLCHAFCVYDEVCCTSASGCLYKFRSREPVGHQCLTNDLGFLCLGRRIHISGHSDFGILNNLGAPFIFTCVCEQICPAKSASLAMTSITFAAIIGGRRRTLFCEYRVCTRVIFYYVSSEHDWSSVLLVLLVPSPHFEMTDVHQRSKMDCALLCLVLPR